LKKRCVHCLNYFDEITDDHLFPKSWYPENTSPKTQRITIPSCDKCNKEYGKIEEELKTRMGLATNPENEGSQGILTSVKKSMDGAKGRNEKDSKIRAFKKAKMAKDLFEVDEKENKGVFPSLDPPKYNQGEKRAAVPVDAEMIDKFGKKLVKGIIYHESKQYVENPYTIKVMVMKESADNPVDKVLEQQGKTYDFGPGLSVRKAGINDDPIGSVFEITIWQQFRLRAFVLPKKP
jgi:hypothetical protein